MKINETYSLNWRITSLSFCHFQSTILPNFSRYLVNSYSMNSFVDPLAVLVLHIVMDKAEVICPDNEHCFGRYRDISSSFWWRKNGRFPIRRFTLSSLLKFIKAFRCSLPLISVKWFVLWVKWLSEIMY